MPARDAPRDRLALIHDQLTTAVADLASSEAWMRMLRIAARFPQYSPSNVLLIGLQRPDASSVGGIRMWNSLGRRVRKGEKGIAILAPCLYKGGQEADTSPPDPATGEKPAVLRGFRVVHVFDVAQTEGDPLPDVAPALLVGPAPENLWQQLARLAEREAFAVERGDCGGANGYTHYKERRIRVRHDVEPAQAAKTLAHELGHVRAEHETRFADQFAVSASCRGVAEVEAESIAFLVSAAAGLDSSDYTVPYVAGWSGGNAELLRDTAARVLSVARGIIVDAELNAPSTSPGVTAPAVATKPNGIAVRPPELRQELGAR